MSEKTENKKANLEGISNQPVSNVIWVPIEDVQANEYNPNAVAKREMHLLYVSILRDGYTQPIVTIWDSSIKRYVIVDGFHRYLVMKTYKDIWERTDGKLPVVVLQSDIKERMASTIRHNRARGKHSVAGMGNLVFEMLNEGWDDATICAELGMEADELVRLKHITGFSKLFENLEYSQAWETRRMIRYQKAFEEKEKNSAQKDESR